MSDEGVQTLSVLSQNAIDLLTDPLVAPLLEQVNAERSLYSFYRNFVWPIVEPTEPFIDGWHEGYLCELFEAVSFGQLRFLLINCQPRLGKSLKASVAWPAWDWFRGNCGQRFICGSYSEDLRDDLAMKRRRVVQDAKYIAGQPKAQLVNDRLDGLINASAGQFHATMTGSTVAGFGGSICLDDPMNPDWADSESMTKRANNWISKNFATRMNNPRCSFVVIMQRLSVTDCTAYLLRRADWHHVVLNALPDATRTYVFPRSGTIHTQHAGEPACPSRTPLEELKVISRLIDGDIAGTLDGPGFSAQYLQAPIAGSGGTIERRFLKFWHYPHSPLPAVEFPNGTDTIRCGVVPCPDIDAFDLVYQSWDLSVDATGRSAETAGCVFGRMGTDKFLLDMDAQVMDFLAQIDSIGAMTQRWPRSASMILVENKGNGAALIRAKSAEWPGLQPVNLPTHGGGAQKGKDARLNEALPQFRSGRVYLPHPDIAPWVSDVIKQICGSSRKRDIMDAMSQGLCSPLVNEEEFCVV